MASEALSFDRPARTATALASTRAHLRAVSVQVLPQLAGKTVDRSALKKQVLATLFDILGLSPLSTMGFDEAREEIFDLANDAIRAKRVALSIAEQEVLLEDVCNELLCAASSELLFARDHIADTRLDDRCSGRAAANFAAALNSAAVGARGDPPREGAARLGRVMERQATLSEI